MSDDLGRFLDRHLRRRLEAAAVSADAADLTRLVSFEPIPMAAAAPEPASGPDAQTLVRYELGFRRGDVSVELNAHDGQPLSWLFAKLAEGDGPPPAPAAALATATAAADPPADAVLTQSGYEELGGKPVFVAHWEHHHEGVVVERDYIRVLVSGGSGRVFAVHRRWHAVDFNPTER